MDLKEILKNIKLQNNLQWQQLKLNNFKQVIESVISPFYFSISSALLKI